MPAPFGDAFHGEFSSADASALSEAASRITLYQRGSKTALVLNANDQVTITDGHISVGTQIATTIYDGADNVVDAGETIMKLDAPIHTSPISNMTIPHYCQKGTWPKVKTSAAGQVDVSIKGTILRLGA